MSTHTCTALPAAIILMSVIFHPGHASCRLNLPEIEGQTRIEGQDHQALKASFSRSGQYLAQGSGGPEARRILVQALPEGYKKGCAEMVASFGAGAEGTEGISVRVLYAEGTQEEGPIRALLAYACFSKARAYGNRFRDERLAALVVDKNVSRLSMMPDDRDCENCPELTRIRPEKEVRIGGKGVVGLSFLKTNENPCCNPPAFISEERVRFYLIEDSGVKRAGSVLKEREEHGAREGPDAIRTVYRAGVILKKDMKGNVVGILSPYTIMENDRRAAKGMGRYGWSAERGEFVKE